jgi:hypothetical protein
MSTCAERICCPRVRAAPSVVLLAGRLPAHWGQMIRLDALGYAAGDSDVVTLWNGSTVGQRPHNPAHGHCGSPVAGLAHRGPVVPVLAPYTARQDAGECLHVVRVIGAVDAH